MRKPLARLSSTKISRKIQAFSYTMTSHYDESQKLILDLVERSPIPTLIVSYVDHRHILINKSLQRLLGYTIDDIPTIEEWWHLAYPDKQYSAEIRAEWEAYMARLESGETSVEPVEAKVRCKDGSYKYASVSCSLYDNLQMVVFNDLTDRMKSEEETKATIALLNTTIESTSDGLLVVDNEGKILRYNQRFAEIWRIPESVLEEKSDEKALECVMSCLADPEAFLAEVKRLYDHADEKSIDIIELKDGRLLERNSHPQMLGGKIIGRVWVFRDATKRIRAERSLQMNEQKYRMLFENMTAGFALHEMIYDENGNPKDYRYLEINPAFEKLTGVPPSALIGKTVKEVLPNIEQYWIDIYGKVVRTGEPISYINFAKELGKYYDTWSFRTDKDQFAVVFTDATDRILAEEERERAAAEIHDLYNLAPCGYHSIDKDGILLRVNDTELSWLGYTREELMGKRFPDLYTPESQKTFRESYPKFVGTGKQSSVEISIIRKNGSILPVILHATPVLDESGNFIMTRTTMFDISDRKESEKKLRESEEKYRNIVENAIEGIFQMLPNGKFVSANPALARIFGYESPDELISNVSELATEHSGIEIIAQLTKALMNNNRLENCELLGKREDGSDIWVSVNAYTAETEDGSIIFEGTMVDITQRKHSEAVAAEAKEQAERRAAEIESFISNIADGVVLFDSDGEVIYINEAGQEVLRLPENESFADWKERYSFCYLDGKELEVEELPSSRGMRGETIQDQRLMVVTPWGANLFISVSAAPVMSTNGRILGVTLVFRDQSERMEIERSKDEIYEREHRIAQVLQNALLPQKLPSMAAFETAVVYESASREAEVGGDFYDAFDLGEGKIAIAIGDVTGKGLPAAVRVATARHTLRSCAHLDACPSGVMTMANEVLCKSLTGDEDGVLTAAFAVVDSKNHTITIANGGHEPLLIRRCSGEVEQVCVTGRVLGVMGGFTYPEMQLELAPEDLVVMVTDGITEARNRNGEFLGIEGVCDCLSSPDMKSPSNVVAAILSHAKDFTGGTLRDDAAILCLALKDTH